MKFFSNTGQVIFWAGFIAGSIFWWLAIKFSPGLKSLLADLREGFRRFRESLRADPRIQYFNDLLILYQSKHLAGSLFALEEILTPPRLLAPIARVDPDRDSTPTHTLHQTVPYMPEWPEIYSTFGAPVFSLADSVRQKARILIIGRPGVGKTTALLHLAIQIARQDPRTKGLFLYTPIYLHIADLDISHVNEKDLLAPIQVGMTRQFTGKAQKKLPDLIRLAFERHTALFMVDGLDEVPPNQITQFREYLSKLIHRFPDNLIILASSPDYSDGLLSLEFNPVPMALWNTHQKAEYIQKWHTLWKQHISISPWGEEKSSEDEFIHLNNWLLSDVSARTPLEITLKTWAVYAGDMKGFGNQQALQAYISRMTNRSSNTLVGLERLALRMLLEQQPVVNENDARNWFSNKADLSRWSQNGIVDISQSTIPGAVERRQANVKVQGFSDCVNSGFLIRHGTGLVAFAHPLLTAYLSGISLAYEGGSGAVLEQENWWLKNLSLQYMASGVDASPIVDHIIAKDDVLSQGLFKIARWLTEGSEKAAWKTTIMRKLVGTLQSSSLSLAQRARAMAGLANSGDPAVPIFFRKLIQESDPITRQLAILGLGYLQDVGSTEPIKEQLFDTNPRVGWAACMALSEIGTTKAFDGIATALVQGTEGLQRAAAEALANHPKEGHEMLKEAAEVEELLVRRSSIYGLALIPDQFWVTEILNKLMLNDQQWVVRTAASHALDMFKEGSPFIPYPPKALHETPWLLLFASEQGQGITPGKVARDILHQAAKQGKLEQRLAALDLLHYYAWEDSIPFLYDIFIREKNDLQESSYQVLWFMMMMGLKLPDPMKYGY